MNKKLRSDSALLVDPNALDGPIDFLSVFGRGGPVHIEIGFGAEPFSFLRRPPFRRRTFWASSGPPNFIASLPTASSAEACPMSAFSALRRPDLWPDMFRMDQFGCFISTFLIPGQKDGTTNDGSFPNKILPIFSAVWRSEASLISLPS